MTTATLNDAGTEIIIIDEYGDEWDYFADDMHGGYAVHRHDGDRWQSAFFLRGELYRRDDGATFGVNCSDEFIVRDGRWVENED